MKHDSIVVAESDNELSAMYCEYLAQVTENVISRIGFASVALSGGSTPDMIFNKLVSEYENAIDWSKIILFWTDERCVPPDDPQSNYGRAKELLIDKTGIPPQNIFRIRGEDDPAEEAIKYSQLIEANIRVSRNLPCFDLIMLGVGEDGHTASIFTGQEYLFDTEMLTAVSVNPNNSQTRITLTGRLINNASNISIIAAGSKKAQIVSDVLSGNENDLLFPVQLVKPVHGKLTWFLDKEAAQKISNQN
jgi:6-phosphogluconolactonase